MKPEEHKSKSRGISRDMSPEAISRRLDILVELHEVAQALANAKRVGKAEPRTVQARSLEDADGDTGAPS